MSRITFSNGTAKPKPQAAPKPKRPTKVELNMLKRQVTIKRAVAGTIGVVGTVVLGLSVSHCAEAIGILTGAPFMANWSPWYLAIGIDAGMLACEGAELVGTDERTKHWALGVVVGGSIFSAILNIIAFLQHAPASAWFQVPAIVLGIIIPALVLTLFRVAGHLAK
jgi:hypothetical protein